MFKIFVEVEGFGDDVGTSFDTEQPIRPVIVNPSMEINKELETAISPIHMENVQNNKQVSRGLFIFAFEPTKSHSFFCLGSCIYPQYHIAGDRNRRRHTSTRVVPWIHILLCPFRDC